MMRVRVPSLAAQNPFRTPCSRSQNYKGNQDSGRLLNTYNNSCIAEHCFQLSDSVQDDVLSFKFVRISDFKHDVIWHGVKEQRF